MSVATVPAVTFTAVQTHSTNLRGFRIPAQAFRNCLLACAPFCDPHCSRYALGGVALDFQDGSVTFVATDSKRAIILNPVSAVTMADVELPTGVIVIAYKDAKEIARLIGAKGNGMVDVIVSGSTIALRWTKKASPMEYAGKLVEGRFPPYKQVIPAVEDAVATISGTAREFSAWYCAAAAYQGVDLYARDGKATLARHHQPIGKPKALAVSGVIPGSVCLDPQFVREFFDSQADKATAVMHIVSDDKAVRIDCGMSTYVLMPLARD